MIPPWLHTISMISVVLGIVCASTIGADEFRRPQKMWIMNVVWPATALFGSVLVLCAYAAFGRSTPNADNLTEAEKKEKERSSGGQNRDDAHGGGHSEGPPFAVKVGKGALHCGSGCTLGDICAEWLAFLVPAVAVWFGWQSVFETKLFAVWILDFLFAFAFGIAFQYFTIKPMRDLSVAEGLVQSVKADVASLSAWQLGMYGFMAVAYFWIFRRVLGVELTVDTVEFWFMMQIAMLCGFMTSYPVNWWLIRAGVKEAM